ncbi:MAG: GNAT family N-acetyltransferase [Planctomycetes bacterium]|nr:GNAT family N-acetyltransferase [Planctomycetota bacterium]
MSANTITARTLIEQVMRDGRSIADEYPTVFGACASGGLVTVEEAGELRAACAIQPRDLVAGAARLRIGLVGSVVTDPAHQNQGWGTRLLAAAEDALRQDGCVLALLWADDRGFYARRGWREIGCERDFIVSRENVDALPAATDCRAANEGDACSIHALYLLHDRRVERLELETAELLHCPGMEVLVHEERGRVDAYACLGRGRDLPNVVHEWGGASDGVLRLLRAHVERRTARGIDDELYVMAPGAHGEVQGRIALAGVPSAVGVLGMGKLLDAEGLARACAEVLGPRGVVRARAVDRGQVEFRGPRGLCVVTHDALLDIAVAARGERGAARELALALGVEVRDLPMNPFVWGLDSI